MSDGDARAAIVQACLRLEAAGLVSGSSGNVSLRLPPDRAGERFAITPAGVRYRDLQPDRIAVIDATGASAEAGGRPSSETPTHLAVYATRPDVRAVIHTHSAHASALAVAGDEIPAIIDEQVVLIGGSVAVAEYAASGTTVLGRNAVAALSDRLAVLLRNHGALGAGCDLEEALDVVTLVERLAHTYLHARAIGGASPLPDETIEAGRAAFVARRAAREAGDD